MCQSSRHWPAARIGLAAADHPVVGRVARIVPARDDGEDGLAVDAEVDGLRDGAGWAGCGVVGGGHDRTGMVGVV